MSKYRYLTVSVSTDRAYERILLPDDWDDLTEDQRISYIKQEAFAEMKISYGSDLSLARAVARWSIEDFSDWRIESGSRNSSEPIEICAAKPKALLILDGIYEHDEYVDDYDDEEID